MHTIALDGTQSYLVPDTVFAQIQTLVAKHSVCRLCENPFDEKTNPNVVHSVCLACFRQENSSLHLEPEPQAITDENGRQSYVFLDAEGYVYTPVPASDSIEAVENIPATLSFWDFPDISSIELEGKAVELDPQDASIFGDVRHNSVVVVSKRKLGGRIEVVYLSYKNGQCVYLDKAKGKTRKLWREAESAYLATRDVRGRYHYKERVSRYPVQGDIYCLLSDRESAVYDKQQQEG